MDSDAALTREAPSLADLVTILYRPRETMRRILDSGGSRWEVQVVILAFVCASVTDTDVQRFAEVLPGLKILPVMAIVALTIIVGSATWVIALFIIAGIATAVGRMLGGKANFADVRAALGWGMVPIVWSAIYRIPLLIVESRFPIGPQPNARQLFFDFMAHGSCSIIVIFLTFQLLFAIGCVVLGSFTLAEAQRFSTEKGFANVAISIALPLLVIAAAVFTFRK